MYKKENSKSSLSKQYQTDTKVFNHTQFKSSHQKQPPKQKINIQKFYRNDHQIKQISSSPSQSQSNCSNKNTNNTLLFSDKFRQNEKMRPNADMQMHIQMKDTRIKKFDADANTYLHNYNNKKQHICNDPTPSKVRDYHNPISKKYRNILNLNKHDQQQYNDLYQQNIQLKEEIVELKVSQFYQVDDEKLKQLLIKVQELKAQIKRVRSQNQALKLENDFLNRSNFQLKVQLQKKTFIIDHQDARQSQGQFYQLQTKKSKLNLDQRKKKSANKHSIKNQHEPRPKTSFTQRLPNNNYLQTHSPRKSEQLGNGALTLKQVKTTQQIQIEQQKYLTSQINNKLCKVHSMQQLLVLADSDLELARDRKMKANIGSSKHLYLGGILESEGKYHKHTNKNTNMNTDRCRQNNVNADDNNYTEVDQHKVSPQAYICRSRKRKGQIQPGNPNKL